MTKNCNAAIYFLRTFQWRIQYSWYKELKTDDKIRLKVSNHKSFYASKTANVIFSGKYLRQIRVNVAYSFSDSDISEEEDKDD